MFGSTAVKTLIQRNPTLFNCFTGGTLCFLSDAGAQRIEANNKNSDGDLNTRFDYQRMLVASVIGMFFGGFVYPNAYAIIDARWYRKTFPSILTKSVVEIATVGIFVNTVSMTCRGLLAGGRSRGEVVQHVAHEMPKVTMKDFGVWLPYNLLAFSVIPPLIRPTTTIFMEASWQTYISLRSNDYEKRAASVAASAKSGKQRKSRRRDARVTTSDDSRGTSSRTIPH